MESIPWNTIIIAIFIIIITIILKTPITEFIKNLKSLKIRDKNRLLQMDTRDITKEIITKNNGTKIERTESESIVTAKEVDKISYDIEKFPTSEAYSFYQAIANYYDKMNSEHLLETHNRIVNELLEIINKENSSVLDLGGGTGKYIAIGVASRKNNKIGLWVNFDLSENMQQVFNGQMQIYELKYQIIKGDLFKIDTYQFNTKFDVAILSFVLSSLVEIPNFKKIKKHLKKEAYLIVAEGDPIYTIKNGSVWPVKIDTTRKELSLNPINPIKIIVKAEEAGFKLNDAKLVKKHIPRDNSIIDYSYILTFIAT